MSMASVVVRGSVTSDGALNVNERIPLPAGPVQIIISPATEPTNPDETGGNTGGKPQDLENRGDFRPPRKSRPSESASGNELTTNHTCGMLIYCDSVILIYYFDHVGPNQTRRQSVGCHSRNQGPGRVSELVRMEYRVAPVRQTIARLNALKVLQAYRRHQSGSRRSSTAATNIRIPQFQNHRRDKLCGCNRIV